MKGIIRYGGIDVPFAYSESLSGPDTLQTVLPDGERFTGEVVEYGSRTMQTAQTGSTGTAVSPNRLEAVENFEGNKEAVLFGDRGHSMRCRFKVSDIMMGFAAGGYGICQVSDGRVIDLYF